MKEQNKLNPHYQVIIYNDNETPSSFVTQLICHITGKPNYESEEITKKIDQAGKFAFGPYPESIAKAIFSEAKKFISTEKYPLVVEVFNTLKPNDLSVASCSFCGKNSNVVEKLLSAPNALICNECIVLGARELQNELQSANLQYTHQLLDWHLGKLSADKFVKTSRSYPGRVRADLQLAIDKLFTSKAIRSIGIKQQYGYEQIDLTSLWKKGRGAHGIAPLSYEELDIGEINPIKCQLNGLWLLEEDGVRYAVVLSRDNDYAGGFSISLEVSGQQGEGIANITRKIFDEIEASINLAHSYRGKVLSLEKPPSYGGKSEGITVHKMQPVNQDQVILPKKTLEELDRVIIRFCQNRKHLRKLGLGTKRGVMFHGDPGTGKTHTIRYIASKLVGHTTFLITAEQIALLPEYFALARLMQPVIFVIEDADLLAKSRNVMHSPNEEILLNHLLNEMDGLKEEADILFVLSTNKPEILEEALIARPGRIDQLIEFPKPDIDCRIRLIDLYKGKLKIIQKLKEDIANRTDGVSASFIKELMRRLAQYAIERNGDGNINDLDVKQALDEMLFSNNQLNSTILGAK